MNTPSRREWILAELARYRTGGVCLRDMRRSLIPAIWDISAQDDPETYRLACGILHRLAEYSNGDWDDDELKDLLGRLADGENTQ